MRTGATDCHLCDLTFGRLLKDRSWKAFVDELPYDVDFQLRSTFRTGHPDLDVDAFPAAFLIGSDGVPVPVLTAEEIDAADDLDALRSLVTDLVERLGREAAERHA